MTNVRVKIEHVQRSPTGMLVSFAWRSRGGKWSRETLNFSRASTKREILAWIKQRVTTKIAEDSITPPDLSGEIGVERDLADLPDHEIRQGS